MSYCVNCGVKLASSEKKCPLCNTVVYNPNIKEDSYYPNYSDKIEKFKSINFRYIVKLCVLVLFVLGVISIFCDLIITKKISWSIYVVCSILYLSCHLSFIMRKGIKIPLLLELIGSELFMFVIAYLNDGLSWYLYLAMPFIFILWVYIVLCIYLVKRKTKSLLRRIAICLMFSSITLIIIEVLIDLYLRKEVLLTWSIYAMLPISIISTLILILSFNRKLLDEIKQRIFI